MTAIRPKLFTLLAPLAAFGCLLALLLALNAGSAPQPSAAPADLAAPAGAPADERLRALEDALRSGSGEPATYAALGDALLQRARESGDPSYLRRAERAFDAALSRDPRELDALVGAGTLANLRHDFREGLRLGLEASRLAPELARALPVVADAQLELGRYGAATATTQRLVDTRPGLASYARASYVRELKGDLAGAAEAMRLAVSAGGAPESRAYVETLLGDLELARGRPGAAGDAYRGALLSFPDYPQALVGLARVDAAAGELGRAGGRLRRATERLPLTAALTLLAETELAAGRTERARAELELVRAQHRLLRAGGTVPDAELVVFEATHGDPGGAVALGRRVWRSAPSVRSADALGWALTRAGRPAEGLGWARRALRLGSRDPAFRLHAGIAAGRAGRPAEAARQLRLALAGAPALSPLAAMQARAALEELR